MPIKGLTHSGQLIDADAVGAAFQVDTDEPGHEILIKSVRDRYALEHPGVAVAHEAVDGVAVPTSPDDTESLQDKSDRLKSEGAVPNGAIVQTTQGTKLESEISSAGLGVDPSKSGNADDGGANGNPPPPPAVPERSADEAALVAALGEPIAQKLFDAGVNSREVLAGKTAADLDAIPGIGNASIEKIQTFLAS